MVTVSTGFALGRCLGGAPEGSHTQTARVRELRTPGVVMRTEVVRIWVSWDSSRPAAGSRLSADSRPHVSDSIPSVVSALLRL
jgi:hypothetical protein